MSDALGEGFMQVLTKAGAELAATVFGLIVVGVPVLLAACVLIRRLAAGHGVGISIDARASGRPVGARLVGLARQDRMQSDEVAKDFDPRRVLADIHMVLMLLVALVLFAGAALAYATATAGNGLLLVAIILFLLSLYALGSVGKLRRQVGTAEEWRGLWQGLLGKIEVSTSFGEPEVHRMDGAAVALARRMAAEGRSVDDICRAVEPGYGGLERTRQEAFRRVMEAMLDHHAGR